VDILVKGLEKEDLDNIVAKPSFDDYADKLREAMVDLREQDAKA